MCVTQCVGVRSPLHSRVHVCHHRFKSDVCVRFKPQYIAAACVYLASKFIDTPLPEGWLLAQFPGQPDAVRIVEGTRASPVVVAVCVCDCVPLPPLCAEVVSRLLSLYEADNVGSAKCRSCVMASATGKPVPSSPAPPHTPLSSPAANITSLYGDTPAPVATGTCTLVWHPCVVVPKVCVYLVFVVVMSVSVCVTVLRQPRPAAVLWRASRMSRAHPRSNGTRPSDPPLCVCVWL